MDDLKPKMFSKVLLKDGRTANIVEIFGNYELYLADVDQPDGDIDTIDVKPEDIEKIIDL